jgi:GntR family transcriptional regulator, arabinose operon transcriptional repressor
MIEQDGTIITLMVLSMERYLNKKDIVFDNLKRKIASGEYPSGYKFPSEPVMAKELSVGRITLRSAFELLEQADLIVRVPGKGTFVSSKEERSKDEKRILILFDETSNALESPSKYIIPAFEKACERLNIKTDSMDTSFLRAGNETDVIRRLKRSNYSGVLLNNSYYNGAEKEVLILQQLNIPVLIPHSRAEDYNTTGFAVMHCDNRKGWGEGIEYLLQQGHQRFATLGTCLKENYKNLRGFTESEYFQFLTQLGADDDPALLKYVEYNYGTIYTAVKQLMSLPNPPTAIMCFSDFIALDVYKSLNKLKYKIPEDVAVMGYCGYPGDHLLSPPLSTIDLQYSQIGEKAAKVLYQADEWFGKPGIAVPRIISPHKIVARESTAIKRVEKQLMNA